MEYLLACLCHLKMYQIKTIHLLSKKRDTVTLEFK